MATIIKSNSRKGAQKNIAFTKTAPETKLGGDIPMNSPKTNIDNPPRPWPAASKKT